MSDLTANGKDIFYFHVHLYFCFDAREKVYILVIILSTLQAYMPLEASRSTWGGVIWTNRVGI